MAPSRRGTTYKKWLKKSGPLIIPRQTLFSRDLKKKLTALINVNNTNDDNLNIPIMPSNEIESLRKYDDSNNQCEISILSSSSSSTNGNSSYINNSSSPVNTDYTNNYKQTNEHITNDNHPLYEGCRLSYAQSQVLIMAFVLRFNLTDICLKELLLLLNLLLPVAAFPSKYLFLKNYDTRNPTTLKKFFCDRCKTILDFQEKKKFENNGEVLMKCQKCDKKISNDNFFMHIPLQNQLLDVLENDITLLETILSNQHHRTMDTDILSDVNSGNHYKQLKTADIIQNMDLTIQMNTDGVSPMKSSKISLWPILVTINEQCYENRRKNVLLCGIWAAHNKPDMNIYLKPFVDELIHLQKKGMIFREYKIYVHLLLSSVDAVARPLLQKIHQFNGRFGCSFCLAEGEISEENNSRLYPYTVSSVLRSKPQHKRDCEDAVLNEKIINGIKGPSVLSTIPNFDITKCFSTEYMHGVCLGVVHTFIDLWLDGTYKNENFYLGKKIKEIDTRLLKIQPPVEITRVPQSISDRARWKASEWRSFLLYYSIPVLNGILPTKYFNHWKKLVSSIYIYLQSSITPEDKKIADNNVLNFVQDINKLYGKYLYKFNIHILTHIPKCMQDFGALWAHSTFIYENYNRTLGKLFFNSQSIELQITKQYFRMRKMIPQLREAFFLNEYCENDEVESIDVEHGLPSPESRILFNKFLKTYELIPSLLEYTKDNKYPILLPQRALNKSIELDITEKNIICQLLKTKISAQAFFHEGCRVSQSLKIHSSKHGKLQKRNNSIVQINDGNFVNITKILSISTNNKQKIVFLAKVLLPLTDETVNDLKHTVVEISNVTMAITPDMIKKKCILITDYSSNCDQTTAIVTPLVNEFEKD